MKRQTQRNKAARKSGAKPAPTLASAIPEKSRRDFLHRLRNGAQLGTGLLGGGWYLMEDARAYCREHDLARIGNGIPAVVQVHDPECPPCRALQSEAREALADFAEDEIQYLVANIQTAEGRALAADHGVGNVTLLLFDGEGQRRHILRGNNTSEALKQVFRLHLNATKGDGAS